MPGLPSDRPSPAACTIISRNYLSHARILAQSYLRHHPGGRFYLLVVDRLPEGVDPDPGVRVIEPEELSLPYFHELSFKYDVTEFNTAVKPSLLLLLFNRYQEDEVIYFDPDILITRPLVELREALDAASIVLTPHLLEPIPPDGKRPNEEDILIAGTYNLGFIALKRSDQTHELLHWWKDLLRDGCFVDMNKGFMTDQKWINLVPSYFSSAYILRDETYNVAYWNYHSSPVERRGDEFFVNGRPLAFFHFSGFNPTKPQVFSKHQNRFKVVPGTGLADLLHRYAELQMGHGYAESIRWKYGYSNFENGVPVNLPLRRLYRDFDEEERERFGNPFRTDGEDSFFAWATRPQPEEGGLSPFLLSLYQLRTDLAAAFPDVRGGDRDAFLRWASADGAREMGYDPDAMRVPTGDAADAVTPPAAEEGTGRPRCSVIIPVFNKAALTRQCLDKILADGAQVAFEIVVVDDASGDQTPRLLAGYGDRVRVVTHAANAGFAASVNDGAAAARGDYLVFLNNDTLPQVGWLDALARYADAHPRAAAVGAKLLWPDDTVQHAGVVIVQNGEPSHVYAGFPADHPAVNKSRRFQIVTAACMLIRRGPFEELGGFDTAYRNGNEDVDLCLRLGERGYEIHYCHESVLYHLESVSPGRFAHNQHNEQLYRSRWADRVEQDDFRYYLEDGLLGISAWEMYPVYLTVSPLLAVVDGPERARRLDQMLGLRARQVYALLRDNIQLRVRLQEAEFRGEAAGHAGGPSRNGKAPRGVTLPPRLVREGEVRRLSEEASGRLVSLILPLWSGTGGLPEFLESLLAQPVRDSVEVVALDDGAHEDAAGMLREFGATLVAVDRGPYDSGRVRRLAAKFSRGEILVFLMQNGLPADGRWLAELLAPLDDNPGLAGVCLPLGEAFVSVVRRAVLEGGPEVGRNGDGEAGGLPELVALGGAAEGGEG